MADALSRKKELMGECQGISVIQPRWAQEIMESYENDQEVQQLIVQLSIDPSSVLNTSFQHGILSKDSQVWVGNHGHLRERLIQEMHATPWGEEMGGHSGILPTQQRLRSLFYWPSLLKDVKEMVRSYEVCQRNKGESVPYPGPFQPLPIPTKAWEHVTMDLIDGLPKC